jgi:hypothetical protein
MSLYGRELDRKMKGFHNSGSDLDRKYWIALGLYAALGVLVWFTMGEGKILVMGRAVDLRLVPLLILGLLAFKTVLARHAERIRRGGDEDERSS